MRALGKRTEGAAIAADVGVIDVAVDDVAHAVADGFAAQRIGFSADPMKFVAATGKQALDLHFVKCGAVARTRDDVAQLRRVP